AAVLAAHDGVDRLAERKRERVGEPLGRRHGPLALLAEPPHEPLRDDPLYGAAYEVVRDPELLQARDGADAALGVERPEDHVPGERGLDRDLARLAVS